MKDQLTQTETGYFIESEMNIQSIQQIRSLGGSDVIDVEFSNEFNTAKANFLIDRFDLKDKNQKFKVVITIERIK